MPPFRYSVVVISCRIAVTGFFAAFRCPANPPLVGGANVSSHSRMFACRPLAGGLKILCDRFVEPCGAPRRFLRERESVGLRSGRLAGGSELRVGTRRAFDGSTVSTAVRFPGSGSRTETGNAPFGRMPRDILGEPARPPDFVVWRYGALPPAGSGFLFACAGPERVATPGVIGRTRWRAMRPKRPSKRIEAVRPKPDNLYS